MHQRSVMFTSLGIENAILNLQHRFPNTATLSVWLCLMGMETILQSIATFLYTYICTKVFLNRNMKYSMIMHDVECTMKVDITSKPSVGSYSVREQPTRLASFAHKASLSSRGSAAGVV